MRPNNQVTIPSHVAQALRMNPGDRLLFVVHAGKPDVVRLYRLPRSFAGIAPHAYGGPQQEGGDYIRAEREAWSD